MKSTRNTEGYWVCPQDKSHNEGDEETIKIQIRNKENLAKAEEIIRETLNNEKRKWIKMTPLARKSSVSSRFFLDVLKRLEKEGVLELSAPAKKWRFRMTVKERLKTEYDDAVELYNTYKTEDYNIFRLMNPYEGEDKDFYNSDKGKTKSRRDSINLYSKLAELESEPSPNFVYLRGDQSASGIRENKAGVILVIDKYIDYVNSSIIDVYIDDGTTGTHYWLEPFNPPHGSFIKERIQKEVERKKRKIFTLKTKS